VAQAFHFAILPVAAHGEMTAAQSFTAELRQEGAASSGEEWRVAAGWCRTGKKTRRAGVWGLPRHVARAAAGRHTPAGHPGLTGRWTVAMGHLHGVRPEGERRGVEGRPPAGSQSLLRRNTKRFQIPGPGEGRSTPPLKFEGWGTPVS